MSGLEAAVRTRLGALDLDVGLAVAAGECLALAGPSGAGKTSVLRVIAGLLRPAGGRVTCGGAVWLDTARGIDAPAERRPCGYLFQEYALFGHLSAWRNVAYGLRELPRREREPRARELLGRFGLAGRAEAALLGDRVAVIDAGRVRQEGTASGLAAAPASAFVADFTGAVVLTGHARRGQAGETVVELEGGGELTALEGAPGPVAVSVYPWEIALAPAGEGPHDSARNPPHVEVRSVTTVGARVRVGLAAPQPITAELSEPSARALGLAPGGRAVASFKAAATRVLPR